MTNKEIIDALEADVRQSMKRHADAMARIAKLQRANDAQAAKIRSLETRAKQDGEELARLRLAGAVAGAGGRAAARAQVNRLLREVDRCIALVSDKI